MKNYFYSDGSNNHGLFTLEEFCESLKIFHAFGQQISALKA
ncbi:hypothetical protein RM545_06235 [Zunongwangia sp. F260]|uniref:EF-hand domain-containing protein n=1 Tax=Autumnicola lenta TaxID=3075593 RepID=A0ABU3CIV2_9FLAO|nr:hypothetical protein [Zunongwangia sp. F260]MDT0646282.1 hypothetical protein [Zunongwangia sp. F260]